MNAFLSVEKSYLAAFNGVGADIVGGFFNQAKILAFLHLMWYNFINRKTFEVEVSYKTLCV